MPVFPSFNPYPEESVEYSTLFCRMITANASSLRLQLRDFPIALLEIARLSVWGRLLGAEETGRTTGKCLWLFARCGMVIQITCS